MANRRCFDTGFIASDKFSEHTPMAQILYIKFICAADDEGFVASPRGIMKSMRARKSHMQELIDDELVIVLDFKPFNGEVFVVDWWLHNNLNRRLLKHSECKENLEKYMLENPSPQNKLNKLYERYSEQRKRREKENYKKKPNSTEDNQMATIEETTYDGMIDPRNPNVHDLIQNKISGNR